MANSIKDRKKAIVIKRDRANGVGKQGEASNEIAGE
jgi:hypothetical protein